MKTPLKNALRFGVAVLAASALAAPAFADPAPDPFAILEAGGAGPTSYAILGLGGGDIMIGNKATPDPTIVTGNVGIGAGSGQIQNGITGNTKSEIKGNVVLSNAGQYDSSSPGTVTGSTSVNPTSLATAVTAAETASTIAAGMTATLPMTSFTLGETITGTPGINVINLTGNNFLSGGNSITGTASKSVTFTGGPGTKFVINAPGTLYGLGQSGSLLTSGSVTPTDVLFNFTAPNVNVKELGGGSVIDGILLATGADSTLDTSINVGLNLGWKLNGEAIGQNINVMPDAFVTDPVPEPSSLALLGTGILALGAIGFASRRRTQTAA